VAGNLTVKSIAHRVVKSIGSKSVSEVNVVRYGIEHNGVFVLTTPEHWREGNFVRAIRPGFEKIIHVHGHIPRGTNVSFDAPGMMNHLDLNLEANDGPVVDVIMWNEPFKGIEVRHASQWFCDYFHRDVKCVWLSPQYPRILTASKLNRQFETSWVDTRPFHIISLATIQRLQLLAGELLYDARFRGIVIKGPCEFYGENRWKRIRVNGIEMTAVKRKARCKITCIDPLTGKSGAEPINAAIKDGCKVKVGDKSQILFGVDFVHNIPSDVPVGDHKTVIGRIKVGSGVEVLEFKRLDEE
jgi:uncharacterized protein YcbX